MKRTLLLSFLLFIFTTAIYAQPPGMLNPYTVCDNQNYNGHATFNLTATDPVGSLGLDPAIYTVTFHPSVADGNNNVNAITNPSAYVNETAYSQTIGVRFFNSATSEVAVSGMLLTVTTAVPPTFTVPSYCQGETVVPLPTTSTNGITGTWSPPISDFTSTYVFTPNVGQCSMTATIAVFVNPAPTANPAALYFCDSFELAIFNLNDANNQISTDPNVAITYHETLVDAQLGANPILYGYAPINTPIQILYARVQNPVTGCFSTSTLTLNSHNCTPCTESAPINLSASNITQSSFLLTWNTPSSSTMMGNEASLICIVPQGAPPSDSGAIAVTTTQNHFTISNLQPDNCYSIYVKGFCGSGYSQWSAPLNICMPDCVNSGACSQLFILNAFLDSNHNGIKDTGEVNFNNGQFQYQINNSGSSQYGYTNNGYYYIYDSNPANSYNISFQINGVSTSYYTSSATYTNVTLPTGSGANYLYFPVLEVTSFTNASVNLLSIGQPRPGFTYSNSIMYVNSGNQTIPSGTITFTKDPNLTIVSITEPGATATSNGFTYNFTNLAPFEVRYINVTLSVPVIPTVQLGDLTTNSVTIQVANDTNSLNNSATITHAIVGSYDPNDMSEYHGGKIVHSSFTSNDYLYYAIQFENTGSANADFVRVENTMDTKLDENTFEMIAASHNVNTKRSGNQLSWHFYDINLPSTSSNPSGSHGYVLYKIKPKTGYAIGDIIPNTASIYFDYNPAIVTNTFNTEFVDRLGIADFDTDKIIVSPNPARTIVNINNFNPANTISKVTVYDMLGKRVYTANDDSPEIITIDVSRFTKGIYMVEIISESNIKTTKKLIIN